MKQDNFWTDELVQEFISKIGYFYNIGHSTHSAMQQFRVVKNTKPIKEETENTKEYEILSFFQNYEDGRLWTPIKYSNNVLWALHTDKGEQVTSAYGHEEILKNSLYKIHSVRRVKDNEVFTIGDKIEGFGSNPILTINKFSIDAFDANTISAYDYCGFGRGISSWNKSKEILFTTSDGVKVYNGDKYYHVCEDWDIAHFDTDQEWVNYDSGHSRDFSTRGKAEEYIIMNKQVLSVNDVYERCVNVSELEKLAKERIKL